MVIAGDRIECKSLTIQFAFSVVNHVTPTLLIHPSPPFSTISIRYSIVEDEDGVMGNNKISMQNVLQLNKCEDPKKW